ncbi:MAG TPA: carbonic anhydrase [Polyangiaceae bacterium]|nr:carbonic anhydrase [Polyangiaceae bacterium]HMR73599.1 carbonic anhydrase [Polyangiaceae bacterium]
MQRLAKGIHSFQRGYFASHRQLFEQLATAGQRPETLFVTCSDSRVVPNLITNAPPGELFVIRNAGNLIPHPSLPGGTAASLEYAVEVLEVENIIVCGHTQCGAIGAILDPQSAAHLPFVKRWIEQAAHLPELMKERYAHLTGEALITAAVQENVLSQVEHLREFEFVRKRLDAGKIHLSAWVFKIATGQVFDFNPESAEFEPLSPEASAAPSAPDAGP